MATGTMETITRKKFMSMLGIGAAMAGLSTLVGGCTSLPGEPGFDDLYTKNIYPGSDNTYDIGKPDLAYKNIYVHGLWDDLRTPVNKIKVGTTNPPDDVSYLGSLVLGFADKVAISEQICYFAVQLPHGYKEGTDLEFHIHFVPEDATAGNVAWIFTYSWANKHGVFPVQTSVTTVIPMPGVANKHSRYEITRLTGTDKEISSILLCSLKRNSSNVLDTYNGKSVYLLEVDFHYQLNTMGTEQELTK